MSCWKVLSANCGVWGDIMIDFSYNDAIPYRFFTESELAEAREDLECRKKKILEDLNNVKQDKFYLGCHLIDLFKSAVWSSDSTMIAPGLSLGGKIRGYKFTCFFMQYCEKHFGLDKSQVSRYMNIVDEFGDAMRGYKDEWREYKYSQLVEMLSLTEAQRRDITPQMTVAEIRAYKKNLVATSQQKDNAQTQSDPKPAEPVATSQQEIRRIWSTDFDSRDIYKYLRFCGLSVVQLCDRYLELEAKYNELKASLDITNKSGVTA